jgi:PAS domain-containing protein
MTGLGTFAAAAYQTWLSLNATQRIASIVESSEDAIVSKDLNGVIVTWNKGAERIFGYTAEEVIGKPVTILIPPDRHQEEPAIFRCPFRLSGMPKAKSSARRKSSATLPSASAPRRKSPFSLAKANTEPKTCWRPCKRS